MAKRLSAEEKAAKEAEEKAAEKAAAVARGDIISLYMQVEGFPLDAAVAFTRALTAVCQTWEPVSWIEKDFFGREHKEYPIKIKVDTGLTTSMMIPWGHIESPAFTGFLELGMTKKAGRPILVIQGEIAKDSETVAVNISRRTEQFLREGSLYRGKAIRLMHTREQTQEERKTIDVFGTLPRFLDLSGVDPDQLQFSDTLRDKITTTLFTPLEKSFACRQSGVPLKRGILLAGRYGVGKTLTAYVTAKKATDARWTFVFLDNVDYLEKAIDFAMAYQPAIVYAEDIDQARGVMDRSTRGNRLLNALDSIESKDTEVAVLATTNHIELITPALLRPGRIDAVIVLEPPDAPTIDRLLRMYARGTISAEMDLSSVVKLLVGQIPSVIREVVERTKLTAISKMHEDDDKLSAITLDGLIAESHDVLQHAELIKTMRPPQKFSRLEKSSRLIARALVGHLSTQEDLSILLKDLK